MNGLAFFTRFRNGIGLRLVLCEVGKETVAIITDERNVRDLLMTKDEIK